MKRSISSNIITGVSRVSNDSVCVLLYCLTRVWEDGVCVAVTEVSRMGVCNAVRCNRGMGR